MNREKRIEAMREVADELNGIEGIDDAILDDFAPSTASSGQIVVSLPSDSWVNSDRKRVYDVDENLRSIAQRLHNILSDSDLLNYSVVEKPKKVYRWDGEPLGYNRDYYFVEVVP